ncbi:hypothetical protein WG66_016706 [Moniliophthora roreri]|nr:hypothetical protein WG66_016706 [Moniliophthora roreri]
MSGKPILPYDTKTGQVVCTALHSVAIVFTVYRLIHRFRMSRFAWDDGWAAIALVFESIYLTANWLRVLVVSTKNSVPIQQYRYHSEILMWMITSLFTVIVWTCRISLALSIARILPPGRVRTLTVLFSGSCFLQGAVLIIVKSSICNVDFGRNPIIKCNPSGVVGIVQVLMDVVSTALLVILPLYVLWDWKSRTDRPRRERRLIMLLFMSSLLTLVVCLVHEIHNLQSNPLNFRQGYSAQFESAISLLVCNLLVVVISVYRIIYRRKYHEEDTGPDTSPEDTSTYPSSDPQSVSVSVSAQDTKLAAPFATRFSATDMYTLGSGINSSNASERVKVDDSSFTVPSCSHKTGPGP